MLEVVMGLFLALVPRAVAEARGRKTWWWLFANRLSPCQDVSHGHSMPRPCPHSDDGTLVRTPTTARRRVQRRRLWMVRTSLPGISRNRKQETLLPHGHVRSETQLVILKWLPQFFQLFYSMDLKGVTDRRRSTRIEFWDLGATEATLERASSVGF